MIEALKEKGVTVPAALEGLGKRSKAGIPAAKYSPSIDYDKKSRKTKSAKINPKSLTDERAAKVAIDVRKNSFKNLPSAFIGKNREDIIKSGYTIFINTETGQLCWFNSVSQLIGEMIRRLGVKSARYNPRGKMVAACDQGLDTLYTYLVWDCSLQVVAPKKIVKSIALNFLGIDEDSVEDYLHRPQEAETFYGLFLQMMDEPIDYQKKSKGKLYPNMSFFDFMVFREKSTSTCTNCGEEWFTMKPSSYVSLDIVFGLDVSDLFENQKNFVYRRMACCYRCHKHPAGKDCIKFKRNAETGEFLLNYNVNPPQKIPVKSKKWMIHTSHSILNTPQFLTVHLKRRSWKDEDGTETYNNVHVPIGGNIMNNGFYYRPIAIMSHSNKANHFWSYLNRSENVDVPEWYCINDANQPYQVDDEHGPHGIFMVVYEKTDQKCPKETKEVTDSFGNVKTVRDYQKWGQFDAESLITYIDME